VRKTTKLVLVVPALALAAGMIALASSALASTGSDLSAPAVGQLPAKAELSEVPPDGLSQAVTARDWQETKGSPTRRKWK